MEILNIIDKIYESKYFTISLTIAFICLIVLFIIVLILGKKDEKRRNMPFEETEEDVKDITFTMPENQENIKEDVTFEMPNLTKNLENFKKNLEEEIQNEDIAEVRKTSGLVKPKVQKATKILDIDAIEDTAIVPNISQEENKITQDN